MSISGLSALTGDGYGVGPENYDPGSTAFLAAAGISDPLISNAIDYLVRSLKANGTWSKYLAFYPFVGGTPASHALNLVDSRDLDTSYRLAWVGNMIHGSLGVAGNGGIGNTFITQAIGGTGFHSRSNTSTADFSFGREAVPAQNALRHINHPRWGDGKSYWDIGAQRISYTAPAGSALGHFQCNYSPGVDRHLYRDGVLVDGVSPALSEVIPVTTFPMHILGASNTGTNRGIREYSLFHFSNFLTRAEAVMDGLAIRQFLDMLGRL
jgi:hypothetical protein